MAMFRPEMRALAWTLLLASGLWSPAGAVPAPESVAVLFNSAVPESRQLAEFYREARGIPAANLIALDMPTTPDISREAYETRIAKPLREEFSRRVWWKREMGAGGVIQPVSNRIRVLVTMRGVPLRIEPTPKPPPDPKKPAPAPATPQDLLAGRDEASVDSELAMFGIEGLPINGVLANKFYQSLKPIDTAGMPFLVLTARIDAPTYATCERMIRDAVAAEKTGLWGMAYVDIANKFPQGDQWLESVAKACAKTGMPTVVDRFNETYPINYPMNNAAVYFGWYDWNVSGPFLNPAFRFRRGAVAAHLHSFSAEQLTDPSKNWSGALLERGAAVTIGNVYEPYLHLTHDFGILQQRLLEGYSWVEACWMAMPAVSWQGVVLGDPLYQPFGHLDGSGTVEEHDRAFRALRAAMLRWPSEPSERRHQLEKAGERTRDGIFHESVGLELLQQGMSTEAIVEFRTARALYVNTGDKIRQDFHVIATDRTVNSKDRAIQGLHDAQTRYGPIPETEGLKVWLDILDPPPPPPPVPPAGANKNPPAGAPHKP